MAECNFKETCRFFKEMMANTPTTASMVQAIVCKSNFQECARYRIRTELGAEHLPEDLSPSDTDRANRILKKL